MVNLCQHIGGPSVNTVKVREIAEIGMYRRVLEMAARPCISHEMLEVHVRVLYPQPSPSDTPRGDPDAAHRLDVGGPASQRPV